jgi:hypothetical protein
VSNGKKIELIAAINQQLFALHSKNIEYITVMALSLNAAHDAFA